MREHESFICGSLKCLFMHVEIDFSLDVAGRRNFKKKIKHKHGA